MKWSFQLLVLVALTSTTACNVPRPSDARPLAPKSQDDLCLALGFDPNAEILCHYGTDRDLRLLLEKAFPIGHASQGEVRERLGAYLVEEGTDSMGTPEDRYAVEQTLAPEWPVVAVFNFDTTGVLSSVDIID